MDAKRRVLIVSQYFVPDITAAAFRIKDMYEVLDEISAVDLITTYPHKSHQEVKADSENIFRVNIASKSKSRLVKYLSEYLGFMFKSVFLSGQIQKSYDVVCVTSPPIFVLFSGYLLAKLKKARLVIDIRDLWPDVVIDNGTLSEGSPLFYLAKRFEIFMYKKADLVTCVSKYTRHHIEQASGRDVSVIYNGVSPEEYDVYASIPVKGHDPDKRLNVFYTGNLGFYQHVDIILDTFIKYPELTELFNVHILGGGTELQRFKDTIAERGMKNFTIYGPRSKEETVKTTISNADIMFLNLHQSKTLDKTIPSKLFDYLYFNLPILYGIKGEGKEILDRLGCGAEFEWNSEESLKRALLAVRDNYDGYLAKAAGNREYVYENFNSKMMFRDFWQQTLGSIQAGRG